jgi:hypothetical protein
MLGIAGEVLFSAPHARAHTERFELEYRAHAGCPSRHELVELIERRLGAADASPARIEVSIERDDGASRGTLEFGGDPSTRRSISDAECRNVVEAFAVIAAVELGGEANGLTNVPRHVVTPRASPAQPSNANAPPVAPAPEPPKTRVAVLLGTEFATATGVGPDWAIGPSAFVGARFEHDAQPMWTLRLAALRVETGVVASDPGAARFQLWAARVDACASLSLLSKVVLDPCATTHAGVLEAEGIETDAISETHSASSLWFSSGALGRVQWFLLDALAVEAEASLEANLRRRRFRFEQPNVEIYRTPLFGLFAGIGLAARF